MIDALYPLAREGIPIVGLEPSCLLTLRDEIPALVPGEKTAVVAEHAFLFEEFVVSASRSGAFASPFRPLNRTVKVHGHCHQKAHGAMPAVEEALRLVPGATVDTIESSCCGMAGAFGYGSDTHAISMKMAESLNR